MAHRGSKEDLREVASAVGGDAAMRHGIILAKSIPAKRYGIRTGETILEARQKCPGLILVPPNYALYEKCSAAFLDILKEYSDLVEQYSIDEAFVDMTASCHLFGAPEAVACQIKNRIREELGFTVNIGISSNKLLAKMASDFQKPNRVHTLYPEEIKEKMWPLPVSELFFVGRATAKRLFSMGIHTIGELAMADPIWLKGLLQKQGERIWAFANGIDLSPVLAQAPANKGYGNSTTMPFDVTDSIMAKKILLALSEMVSCRLRADDVQAEVVSIGIRGTDFALEGFPYASHQKHLKTFTNLTLEIYHAACELFDELWDKMPIRHLGVHTGKVHQEDTGRQLCFFDEVDYEKLAKLDKTIDMLRSRFGNDIVTRASILKQSISYE